MDSITDSKWFQILICIVAIMVGVFATWYAASGITLYRAAAARFLPVEASILTHDLHIQSGTRRSAKTYMPVIMYEYRLNGQTYRSDSVLPRPIGHTKAWAEDILSQFPVGTTQTAYYNPDQPEQSYLRETKLSAVYYGVLIFGLLFLLLGSAKSIELLWKTFRT